MTFDAGRKTLYKMIKMELRRDILQRAKGHFIA
jgi:hypothetical protein